MDNSVNIELSSKILCMSKICYLSLLLVKVLDKQHIIKERKQEYVGREKAVLLKLGQHDHPFFVRLYATFQDPTRLCILLSV